jgi:hypothetical protein
VRAHKISHRTTPGIVSARKTPKFHLELDIGPLNRGIAPLGLTARQPERPLPCLALIRNTATASSPLGKLLALSYMPTETEPLAFRTALR